MEKLKRFIAAHGVFLITFLPLYAAFLWPLFTMKSGFLVGDYGLQIYPWSWIYSQSLKAGQLPLWTPLIQCGFPLFAEGQTGMLYLLNLILFKFFPFHFAYNGVFLIHFLMAGLFSYIFSLKKGMGRPAAVLTAVIFTFGSVYAGCFFNIVTMRSLVWFPLALYYADGLFEKGKACAFFFLALVLAQSLLGGSPQVAAYLCFFCSAYFFLRLREKKWPKRAAGAVCALFLGALVLSLLTAAPQLWATFSLAGHSTRLLVDSRFALWGSVAPWSAVTLFFYSWDSFLKAKLYIGIWPLFLLILCPPREEGRIFWGLFFLSVFLALGAFNPFYWIFLKLPLLSLLRNPSKFLFFSAFFLSMLAGFAFDRFLKAAAVGNLEGTRRVYWAAGIFSVIGAAGILMAQAGAGALLGFGRWYTEHFVMGQSFHRKNPEEYWQKIAAIIEKVRHEASVWNPAFWTPFLFATVFILLLYSLRFKRVRTSRVPAIVLIMVFLDIFLFGISGHGTGFIGNIRDFSDFGRYNVYFQDGRWLDSLAEEKALFPPNRNLLSGQEVIGAYSPLLDKNYYLLTAGLGALDDSFGRSGGASDHSKPSLPLLNFLGVRYIVGSGDEKRQFYPVMLSGRHRTIFKNSEAMEEFSFVSRLKHFTSEAQALDYLRGPDFEPGLEAVAVSEMPFAESPEEGYSEIRILDNQPLSATLDVMSQNGGYLVRSQVYDKAWNALVDGQAVKLWRMNGAFQGIPIAKGGHRVEFRYEPSWFIIGRWFYLVGLLVTVTGIIVSGVVSLKKY